MILVLATVLPALVFNVSALSADVVFRAGASVVDITPKKLPVLQNGGFLEATVDRILDPLQARALVLDDGTLRLAIVVVDSCMIPRDVCDHAKSLASAEAHIPVERILIASTHTHSAPSVMNYCLGTRADPEYSKALPPWIAQSIVEAAAKLRPARVGWTVADAGEYTNCRRWILRPDKVREDPFGRRSVRAMMHPGYENPDFIGPAGPIDPQLSLLSVQTDEGRPLALLGNFSMHYFSGHPGLSADYYGRFARKVSERIAPGDDAFVGILSQGTSGDLHWMDYSRPRRRIDIDAYTDGIVEIAVEAYKGIQHVDRVPLSMAEKRIRLERRVPNDERLAWATTVLGDRTKRPSNRPEVYAEHAFYIRDNPEETVVLQALRIGELGLTAIPCEVYGITGLKLKRQSPLQPTMNLELANGAAGYIPPPEQHVLGGYTTWPARTAGLEVQAEPRIVDTVLALLEEASGKERRKIVDTHGRYAQKILAAKPSAYWRFSEMVPPSALDATGKGGDARYEGAVALFLPGPASPEFSGAQENRAVHFAGGWLNTQVRPRSETYTVELWFWNGIPAGIRDVTGVLFAHGRLQLVLGGRGEQAGRLVCGTATGTTPIALRTWYHVAFVRQGSNLTVFLNGNQQPELAGEVASPAAKGPSSGELASAALSIAGAPASTATFEGKIDEVAVYDRVLRAEEIAEHFAAAGVR